MKSHIDNSATRLYSNIDYHGLKIDVFYSPNARNAVLIQNGSFLSGWQLSTGQAYGLQFLGELGGGVMVPQRYVQLIEEYLSQKIGADTFTERFMDMFKAEPSRLPENIHLILDKVFFAAEAYSPDCQEDDLSRLLITETTLRKICGEALGALGNVLE